MKAIKQFVLFIWHWLFPPRHHKSNVIPFIPSKVKVGTIGGKHCKAKHQKGRDLTRNHPNGLVSFGLFSNGNRGRNIGRSA